MSIELAALTPIVKPAARVVAWAHKEFVATDKRALKAICKNAVAIENVRIAWTSRRKIAAELLTICLHPYTIADEASSSRESDLPKDASTPPNKGSDLIPELTDAAKRLQDDAASPLTSRDAWIESLAVLIAVRAGKRLSEGNEEWTTVLSAVKKAKELPGDLPSVAQTWSLDVARRIADSLRTNSRLVSFAAAIEYPREVQLERVQSQAWELAARSLARLATATHRILRVLQVLTVAILLGLGADAANLFDFTGFVAEFWRRVGD